MGSIDVGGLRIAYRRAGTGPPVVLLHGFTQDARVWRAQLKGLAGDLTVVAWDAPGAGDSDDPPETFTIEECADRLGGLVKAMGLERAVFVGLSWGGIVAQVLYRRHPGDVRALVLVDTYAGWKGSLPETVVAERLEGCLRDSVLHPRSSCLATCRACSVPLRALGRVSDWRGSWPTSTRSASG